MCILYTGQAPQKEDTFKMTCYPPCSDHDDEEDDEEDEDEHDDGGGEMMIMMMKIRMRLMMYM